MFDAATPTEDSKTLVITRTLKAPRELVWKMFSDPHHLAQWWGPKGYTNRVEKLDFRTGGKWLHVMIGPDGRELPTDNDIVEVTPPRRIVFRDLFTQPDGVVDPSLPAGETVLSFDSAGAGSRVTVVSTFASAADLDVRAGNSQK